MKNLFPGYYRKTEAEIKAIWDQCILFFDANVLINLYRYSDSTKEAIIDLISKLSDKIRLTHQAAYEYNKNRHDVIIEQEKAYRDFIKQIKQIITDLNSKSKAPFLNETTNIALESIFEKVTAEVNDTIEKYSAYLNADPIYEKISELFKNKITISYDEEKLKNIYSEGEKRYSLKIPPGFKDEKDKSGNEKYGDLIVWKQILDTAIQENKPVIFITDDAKKDWWWIANDKRIFGPRHELVKEIKNLANVDFHMYSTESFLEFGPIFLNEKVNQKAVEEINKFSETNLESSIKLARNLNSLLVIKLEKETLLNKISEVRNSILDLENEIFTTNISDLPIEQIVSYIYDLIQKKKEFEKELNSLQGRLVLLENTESEFYSIDNKSKTSKYARIVQVLPKLFD
ncbi:MAG: PIN domain-containing protein [Saprospiraceae bacterium]